ncbi:unnamed protein product [Urochloa decumbens]|uniref:Rx N-terminal domain-containing protein n=1 Tax=Urochloa decumbens TaxID=240449 RepID=A0ABC8ZBT3_9POAL
MMDIVLSAVGSDLISRFTSFIIQKLQTPVATVDNKTRLKQLLLRAGTIVEEADRRRITNHGMLLQLRQLREAMYHGYYRLDTSGIWAAQTKRKVAVSNYKLQIDMANLEAMLGGMKEFLQILMHCPPIVRQPYSAYLFMEKCMFGRHVEKEHIIDFLLNPCSALDVLPVIGPCYVGKKTLVEHACREEIVQRNFSHILHFNSDDLKNIMNDDYTLDSCRKLGLPNGRFLIVVALVHNTDEVAWGKIYNSLGRLTIGSKAILISEMDQVSSLGTVQALTLTKLQQEEHWYFFRVLAFGSANPYDHHPDLAPIAKEIAREMHGSFMITNTVTRMLRASMNKQFWRRILGYIKKSLDMHILVFGEDLRDDTKSRKRCLSYFHTFRHDSDGPLMLFCEQRYETRSMIQGDITSMKTAEEVLDANDLKHGDKFDVIMQSQIPPYYKYISKCVVQKSTSVYPGNKCLKRKRNQLKS